MDGITHSMTGLFVGAGMAYRKEKVYPIVVTGVLASILPDLDAVIAVHSMEAFHAYHRDFTHTVFVLPALAALAATPGWIWARKDYAYIYLTACLAIAIHLAMDVLCAWEIMLFYPLTEKDYSMNLFNGRDTSVAVFAIMTITSITMWYFLQKRLDRRKSKSEEARAP